MPTTTSPRTNRYAGRCVRCMGHIPAGRGIVHRDVHGSWRVEHDGECPAIAPHPFVVDHGTGSSLCVQCGHARALPAHNVTTPGVVGIDYTPGPASDASNPVLPPAATVAADQHRWVRVSGEWLVTGPDAVVGDSIDVHSTDGSHRSVRITELAGKHRGTMTYRINDTRGTVNETYGIATAAFVNAQGVTVEPNRVYMTVDNSIVRTRTRRNSTQMVADLWWPRLSADGTRDRGSWQYSRSALGAIARTLTASEAAHFGHTTQRCVFCRRALSDGRSTRVGYGETCAAHYGLPWG